MRTNSNWTEMNDLLMQNIMQNECEKENIKCSIATTTCCITERLPVHQLTERWIKKIYNSNDPILKVIYYIFHEPANIQLAFCRCNPRETTIFAGIEITTG